MFKDFKEIESAIGQAIQKLWPEQPSKVDFRPMLSRGFDQVCSECCIRLAEALHQPPAQIVKSILAELPAQLVAKLKLENGFLNLSISNDQMLDLKVKITEILSPEISSALIVIAAPDPSCFGWSYIRLVSLALVQRDLLAQLGIATKLQIFNQDYSALSSAAVLQRALELALEDKRVPKADLALQVLSRSGENYDQIYVWADGPIFSSEELHHLPENQRAKIVLRYPNHRLLYPHDMMLDLKELRLWDAAQLKSLILTLSLPLPGYEIDPRMAILAESFNPAWLFESTLQRLERSGRVTLPKSLVVPLRFLPHFVALGAINGEVAELFSIIIEVLRGINHQLNSPNGPSSIQIDQVELCSFLDDSIGPILATSTLPKG